LGSASVGVMWGLINLNVCVEVCVCALCCVPPRLTHKEDCCGDDFSESVARELFRILSCRPKVLREKMLVQDGATAGSCLRMAWSATVRWVLLRFSVTTYLDIVYL